MALTRRKEQPVINEEKSIDINAEMQGSLLFKDPVNLKINGNFNGTLHVRGTLTVGNRAVVNANIEGDNIIIAGRVTGDVTAHTMLVLMPTAILNGNVITPKLNIVEGAIFNGSCQMKEDFLSIDDVSKYLEIDMREIIELATSGKIPATRSGDNWKFERSKIDAWATSGEVA